MGRRKWLGEIEVSVDLRDALEQIDTDDLIQEIRDRGRGVPYSELGSEWIDRLRFYLLRGDVHGALAMLTSEEVRAMVADEARAVQYEHAPKLQ